MRWLGGNYELTPFSSQPIQGNAVQRLKNVRNRRSDALTQVGWEQLEVLLAAYYRGQGYAVDHCGTGATGNRFDGGIDLKLRKDDAYILVQCKHWNAKQVPHNDVHQLIGLMVNEGATGAILVTSGEFTRAAIEAAAKQGHVQLVDGDDLRDLLGPLPLPGTSASRPETPAYGRRIASTVGERLLSAAEDRIRHGGTPRRRGGGLVGTSVKAGLVALLLKFVFAFVMVLLLTATLQSVIKSILPSSPGAAGVSQSTPLKMRPAAGPVLQGEALQAAGRRERLQPNAGESQTAAYRRPTTAEMRERQRQADEAARIIEASTPEM